MTSSPIPSPEEAPITGWRRYARVYAAMWTNSVVREMGFKANFLLWIVVEMLWFALQLSFFGVIYQHTERIADWSRWEAVLLVGASHFIQQVFQAFFLVNCTNLSELIRTGKMDFMMLLPVNTRFLVSLRNVDLGAFINAASAVGVMAFALHRLGKVPSGTQIIGFLLLSAAGILIHYSLMFLLSTISFWTVRAQGIVYGYYNLFNIARYPDGTFRGWFRVVFTFVLPMTLVSNVPAKVLVDRLDHPLDILWLLLVGIGIAMVSEGVWRWSLRHYTSASS